jgi:chromosome segregation ATPase|mmetsp:Transcript_62179/g.182301  ORF Transcript_62179/g.182301 Transcript_62179/m.182301 type:complete len:739 (+) Transcript_62179:154-2370(+)
MRHLAARLVVLVIAATTAARADFSTEESYSGNPVQKVVQLISQLEAKVIKDGDLESKMYDKYVSWCGKTSQEKQFSLKETNLEIEKLEANIAKAKDDSNSAKSQIVDVIGSMMTDTNDLRAATLLRAKEKKDFEAFDDDLAGTIQTLTRAREVLLKELKKGGAKAASFLQQPTSGMNLFAASLSQLVGAAEVISGDDRKKLVSLIETAQTASDSEEDGEVTAFEGLDLSASTAAATLVDGTSGGSPLLAALKELQGKSEDTQRAAVKKEESAANDFAFLKQSLEGKIAAENKELVEGRKDKAEADEIRANSEGKLEEAKKRANLDQAYLAKLHYECMQRASRFEDQQKDRKAEMSALAEAKKAVLDAMSPGGKVYSFLQTRSRRSRIRAHVRRHVTGLSTENAQVAFTEIKKVASLTGSVAMTQLVSRLSAAMHYASTQADVSTGNPFTKVKEIMRTMIAKLQDEAAKEATQKAFCDRELAVTAKSKDEKESKRDDLLALIDTMAADMANLDQEIKGLDEKVAEIASSQDELDKAQAEEEADFKAIKEDLQEGLAALKVALKVLRRYFGEQADKGEAVQEAAEAAKAAADEQRDDHEHLSQPVATPSDGADAIISLLETVEADFAKHVASKDEQDSSSRDEYDDMTAKNRLAKGVLEAGISAKSAEMVNLKKKAAELKSDSEDTEQELQAVRDYLSQLEAKCREEPETAQQRMEARRREIEGLKTALAALDGEAAENS